jgi:inosine-uridine nucleoside N-ribohydrolase
MLKKLFTFVFFLSCLALSRAQIPAAPVPIIFDSDMGPDYDDVGAITILHTYADSGRVKILATVASTKYAGVAGVMNVFNTYFRRANIPIGVPKGKALQLRDFQHWTDTLLAKYPHKIKSNDDVPDAVEVYRKALASQQDKSVTIVTVGFLTNLSNLLQSTADKYSPLDGKALVAQKVKQLVCMAGRFPFGSEFNVNQDAHASQYTYNNWPTPVIFSGFEIGMKIKAGLPLIHNNAITNSPVKNVFSICIPMAAEDSLGRMSWDETAVLVACGGYKPYYKLQYGHINVAADGSNTWSSEGTQQAYLIEQQDAAVVQVVINQLIMHKPGK